MMALIAFVGHTLAALFFGLVAAFEARQPQRDARRWALITACAATALWATAAASVGGDTPLSALAETVRNLAWLGFMLLLYRQGEARSSRPLTPVFGALAFVLLAQAALVYLPTLIAHRPNAVGAIMMAGFVMRMIFAAGALLVVHNIYAAADAPARRSLALVMGALATLWAYDLNLYTLSYIAHEWLTALADARGWVVAGLAPVVALAARRNRHWRITLSRKVAFRSLPVAAAAIYILLALAASALFEAIGAADAQFVQVSFLILAAIAAVVVLPSPRARAWIRVMAAKHLFAHRFDYRVEWLRFTATIGRPGDSPAPLQTRVIKAIADIVEAPAGLLLLSEVDGLAAKASWNRSTDVPLTSPKLVGLLETGRIIALDELRADNADPAEVGAVAEWILADRDAWAIVPLIHFERFAGAVLLDRPAVARTLDWEDFDLLRVVGRQVASYLAEAQGQIALSEAQRFEEFNRRFAFIMHDIKNLVSQLSLVARNAERHADKPEFRTDMIATLNSSTARMNDLLAKLSQHHKARPEEPRAIGVANVVNAVALAKRKHHPVVVAGDARLLAVTDPVRLEAALAHIVQNAIDASAALEPVTIVMQQVGDEATIEVQDQGVGMSADFIAGQLFRPFTSTKDNGFGIGAYEARALIAAMGGRLTVRSAPGAGSTFTICLPSLSSWTKERAA